MRLFYLILILTIPGSVLFSQYEASIELDQQIGVQLIYNSRSFGNLKIKSSVGTTGYEYLTSIGSKLVFYIGANNFIITATHSNISDMVSKYSIFYGVGLYHPYRVFYLKGKVLHYKAKGQSTFIENEIVKYTFNNNYSFYEYPMGAGFVLIKKRITVSLGFTKSYFYGTNEKNLVIDNNVNEVGFGKLSYSFMAELPIAFEINGRFDLTPKLNIRLNYTLFGKRDFAIKISLWSHYTQKPTI